MPNRATALLLWYTLTACCLVVMKCALDTVRFAALGSFEARRRDVRASAAGTSTSSLTLSPPPLLFDAALFFSHACFLRRFHTSEWCRCVYCGPRRPKRGQSRHQTAAHGALRKHGQVNSSGMLRVLSVPRQLRRTRLMFRVCSNPLLRSISQARA